MNIDDSGSHKKENLLHTPTPQTNISLKQKKFQVVAHSPHLLRVSKIMQFLLRISFFDFVTMPTWTLVHLYQVFLIASVPCLRIAVSVVHAYFDLLQSFLSNKVVDGKN